jgi:acetyl esterase/lipase
MDERITFEDVLALEAPEPDAVIPYCTNESGDDEKQFGELWLTKGVSKGLVVYIHGGCWLNTFNIDHSRPLCHAFAQRGLTTFSLEYRRVGDPGGGYPGTFDDIATAIARLSVLEQWNIDVSRPVIAGHSAGGHLALWAGAAHRDAIAGVLGLAPIADLERYAQGESLCEKATVKLMGGTPNEIPDLYRSVSPAQLDLHDNTFIVHGTDDTVVPLVQAKSVDIPADRLVEISAGHFDLIHPGTSAFDVVLETISRAIT